MLYLLLAILLATLFAIYHMAGLTAVMRKVYAGLNDPAKPERPEPKYPLLVSELKDGGFYRCAISDRLVKVYKIRGYDDPKLRSWAMASVFNQAKGQTESIQYNDNDLYTTNIDLAPRALLEREKLNKMLLDFGMTDERRQRERRQREEAAKLAAMEYTAPTEDRGIPGLMEMDTPEPPPPPPDRIIHEGEAPVPPRQPQSRIQRILQMPPSTEKLNLLVGHEQEVLRIKPCCTGCGEVAQIQLVDHANLGGPLFKCRQCKWKFNAPLLT